MFRRPQMFVIDDDKVLQPWIHKHYPLSWFYKCDCAWGHVKDSDSFLYNIICPLTGKENLYLYMNSEILTITWD